MPSGKNVWLTYLTFDLSIKIEILHALLTVSMPSILLVMQPTKQSSECNHQYTPRGRSRNQQKGGTVHKKGSMALPQNFF